MQLRPQGLRAQEGEVNTTRDLHLRRGTATTVFLVAAGLLLAYLTFQIARPFLTALAWSTILAVIFAPLHRRIRSVLRYETLSAVASSFATLLVGVLPLVLIVSAISREAAQGYRQVRDQLTAVSANEQTPMGEVGSAWRRLSEKLRQWGVDVGALGSQAGSYLGEGALFVAKGTITNLSAFVLNLLLVAITLFFFFRDGPSILEHIAMTLPVDLAASGGVYELIAQVIRAAIFGVAVMSIIKGVLAGLAFWVLGLDSPALWGAAATIASVVPVFGTSLVWIPAAVVLWIQGSVLKALIMVIWGLTVLSLIDNFLYPILVRSRVRLHTLVVFVSTLGGLSVFGFLGFVLGPVVAILTLTLIDAASHYYSRPRVTLTDTGGPADLLSHSDDRA